MADSEIEYDDEFVGDAGEEDEVGDGAVWVDAVFQNLEDAHYSCGAIVFPACGIGSPHIRLRTWFVAERSLANVVGMEDAELSERTRHGVFSGESICEQEAKRLAGRRLADGLAHEGSDTRLLQGKRLGRLDNANGRRCSERELGDKAGSQCASSGGRAERGEGCGRNDASDAVSGNGLANSEYAERRQERVNREDGCDGQDGGRQEAYGESGACGEVLGLADSHKQGSSGRGVSRSAEGDGEGLGTARERSQGLCPDVGMANAAGIVNQRNIELEGSSRERQGPIGGDDSFGGLADTSTDGRREERPISGGLGAGYGTEGWPAGSDARGIAGGLVYADSCGADSLGRSDSQDGEEAPRGARADDSSDLHDGTGPVGGMDDSPSSRHIGPLGGPESNSRHEAWVRGPSSGFEESRVADTNGGNASAKREQRSGQQRLQPQDDLFVWEGNFGIGHNGGPGIQGTDPTDGFWGNPDWLFCRDGKWRPIVSGASALAHGLPRGMGTLSPELRRLAEMAGLDGKSLARAKKYRIGSLKGYGNAIVSDVAVEIIKAYMEHVDERD